MEKELEWSHAWIYLVKSGFTTKTAINLIGALKKQVKKPQSEKMPFDFSTLIGYVYAQLQQHVKRQDPHKVSSMFRPTYLMSEPGLQAALSKSTFLCSLVAQWLIAASHSLQIDLVQVLLAAQVYYPELALSVARGGAPIARVTVHRLMSSFPHMVLTVACWVTVVEEKEGIIKETFMVLTVGSHVWNEPDTNDNDTTFKVRLKSGNFVPCVLREDLSTSEFAMLETNIEPGSEENVLPLSLAARLFSSSFDLLAPPSQPQPKPVWKCGYGSGITSGNANYEDQLLLINSAECENFGSDGDCGSLILGQIGAFLIPVGILVASDDTMAYGISLESVRQRLNGKCQSANVKFPACFPFVQDYVRAIESEIFRVKVSEFVAAHTEISYVSLAFHTPETLDELPSCIMTTENPDSIDSSTKQEFASQRISISKKPGSPISYTGAQQAIKE